MNPTPSMNELGQGPSRNDLAGAFDLFVQASQALEKQHAALALKVDALSADLVKANDRLNTLLDALPAAVILVEEGRVTHLNPAAAALLPGLVSQSPWSIPTDWTAGEGPNEYHFMVGERRQTVQLQQIVHPEGSVIQIQDITDNLRMLEESERVDRLAAMGKMSAAIAHQLRTPLSTALLYASHLCNPDLAKDDQIDFASRLQSQLLNLNKLAGNMLQFIRARPQKTSIVALDDLVREACESLEALQQQRQVSLTLDLQAADCQVSVERASMVAALVGIMENALQVCSEGQTILVSTQADHLRANITIDDNGPGIDPQMLQSLFDPFATNRISGTGLGLAIARNTIRSHRGDIQARNRNEGGASFTVVLPSLSSL
jgi:two-component system, sensor histidine kinase FlrB